MKRPGMGRPWPINCYKSKRYQWIEFALILAKPSAIFLRSKMFVAMKKTGNIGQMGMAQNQSQLGNRQVRVNKHAGKTIDPNTVDFI